MNIKKAVVIVAFGTAKDEGFNKYLLPFLKDVKDKYGKEYDYFFSLTSEKMLSKLSLDIKGYKETLEELKNNNYKIVYVEALYLSRGKEYLKVLEATEEYKKYFEKIKVTKPLMEEREDLIDFYINKYKNILFICHGILGSKDNFEEKYINKAIEINKKLDKSYIALINNKEAYKYLLEDIKKDNIKEIAIVPILITKGYHFNIDIISDKDDSILSKLKSINIKVEIIDKVLSQNKLFRNIVLDIFDNMIIE